MMRKNFFRSMAVITFLLLQFSVSAQVISIHTDFRESVKKTTNERFVSEDYTVFTINSSVCNIDVKTWEGTQRPFWHGRYTIMKSEECYDSVKGKGTMFYLNRENAIIAIGVFPDYKVITLASSQNRDFIYCFYFIDFDWN